MEVSLFAGENGEQYNALMQSFQDCSEEEKLDIYGWLEKIPKTSMVVDLVDKLNENGFKITKINN
jgi:hypothetical protein